MSVQLHPLKKVRPQLWYAVKASMTFFSCSRMLPSWAATATALSILAVVGTVTVADFDEHQILTELKPNRHLGDPSSAISAGE